METVDFWSRRAYTHDGTVPETDNGKDYFVKNQAKYGRIVTPGGNLSRAMQNRRERDGRLTRGMDFGHFVNKGGGIPLHPPLKSSIVTLTMISQSGPQTLF